MTPKRYIGEEIAVEFDTPPVLSKDPDCPDRLVWKDETLSVQELLEQWTDFTRRGRFARNMQPEHASVAASRGSWGGMGVRVPKPGFGDSYALKASWIGVPETPVWYTSPL